VNIERNYLRRSYRIKIPAAVYINHKKYPVKDWSFLGFRIENINDKIIKDMTYFIEFELPFVNFIMRFKAKAQCKWRNDTEAGFEFEELPDDTKLLMKEYVEAYIEGRLTEENGLLKLANGLEIPISTDIHMSDEEEQELNKKLIKNTLYVILLIILAGIIGYIIYLNKGNVYSQQAFVSGKTFNIKSPTNGIIKNLQVKPLRYIGKDKLVAVIQNKYISDQIKAYEENINKVEKNINKIKNLIQKEKSIIDKKYSSQIEMQKNKILNLKKLISQKEKYLKKLKNQYKFGIVHYSDIQAVKDEIENLKFQINNIKAQKIIKDYSSLIPLKNFLIAQKKILADLQTQLSLIKSKENYSIIKSPISGKVINVYVKENSIINKNQLIASLETDSKGYVIARFTFKDIKNINIGDSAEIYIPSNNKIYNGIVSAIGKNALKSNSVFSESNIYSQKDIPVKIEFVENNNLNDGIFAEVKIKTK